MDGGTCKYQIFKFTRRPRVLHCKEYQTPYPRRFGHVLGQYLIYMKVIYIKKPNKPKPKKPK